VHTRVVEILYEASARSALELHFEFKEECARWAHQKNLKPWKEEFKGKNTKVIEHSKEEALQVVH
jgi:hypothetical protein